MQTGVSKDSKIMDSFVVALPFFKVRLSSNDKQIEKQKFDSGYEAETDFNH